MLPTPLLAKALRVNRQVKQKFDSRIHESLAANGTSDSQSVDLLGPPLPPCSPCDGASYYLRRSLRHSSFCFWFESAVDEVVVWW